MTVVDASVVVAALIDTGPFGRWAEGVLASGSLSAPHLLHIEVANVLRRSMAAGQISPDTASLAHADLLSLRVELFDYPTCAARVWELRSTHTAYDAWYVALAELLGSRLATLDLRLSRSPGARCEFDVPHV